MQVVSDPKSFRTLNGFGPKSRFGPHYLVGDGVRNVGSETTQFTTYQFGPQILHITLCDNYALKQVDISLDQSKVKFSDIKNPWLPLAKQFSGE